MSSKVKFIISVIVLFIGAVSISVGYFSYQFLNTGYGEETTEILFDVLPGDHMKLIAQKLYDRQLIKNKELFLIYTRYTRANSRLKKGEYSLNQTMSPQDILAILTSGKSVARNLTIAEGLNIFEVSEILEKNHFGTRLENLQILKDPQFINLLLGEKQNSLEGYLFPETYKVTKFDTPKEIITQMVKRFLSVYEELAPDIAQFQQRYPQRKWNRHQIVTFASIVEKETGAAQERPMISSVFHNRLNINMKLQTDPTVIYGQALLSGVVSKNITKQDLLTPTSHNTYTIYGLPPTPISNPGRDSLLAALNPANSKYLYFVSQNDGTHRFSESLEAHNSAVKTFQLNPKAREGKSWRDLKKNK